MTYAEYTVTVNNDQEWPAIDSQGYQKDNYLEWSSDEDYSPLIEQIINFVVSKMDAKFFKTGEEITEKITDKNIKFILNSMLRAKKITTQEIKANFPELIA